MLDFSVLSEKSENFTRTLNEFDLRLALKEVEEIFHEKLMAKNLLISIALKREGFESADIDPND